MKFKPAVYAVVCAVLMVFAFGCSQQQATDTVKQNMVVNTYSRNGNTVSLTLTDASGTLTLTKEYPAANVTIKEDSTADKARITGVQPTFDIGTQSAGYKITISANKQWINANTGSQNTNTAGGNNNQSVQGSNSGSNQQNNGNNGNLQGDNRQNNDNEKQNGEEEHEKGGKEEDND
ncbi:MAG: hypothetical protein LWY06_00200 [Firmicutes bacterium]|nr:hypothetical protein [Bacillota bacterium]